MDGIAVKPAADVSAEPRSIPASMGQIVRIELVSPRLRAQPKDKKVSSK